MAADCSHREPPAAQRILLFVCADERFEQDAAFPHAVYRNGELIGDAPLAVAALRSRRKGLICAGEEAALVFMNPAGKADGVRVCVTTRVLHVWAQPRQSHGVQLGPEWIESVADWIARSDREFT